MSEPKTARERFVEAMKAILTKAKMHEGTGMVGRKVEAACDAFADAEHEAIEIPRGWRHNGKCDGLHERCRASLRTEVFGE